MRRLVVKSLRAVGLFAPARAAWYATLAGVDTASRWTAQRWFDLRYECDRWRHRGRAAGLPLPPAHLDFLVTGRRDIPWYVESGKWAFRSVCMALTRQVVDLHGLGAVLDFGCGSGRVVRYWKGMPLEVHGCDYNARLIDWCRSHLRFAHFRTNSLRPPLDYPDGKFGLVYAMSVFTHLDEEHQHLWIRELQRVLRPGGYLVFTTHGLCPFYLRDLRREDREKLARGEMVVVTEGTVGSNIYGSFHPPGWVERHLARGLEVVEHLPAGAFGNPIQDLYLLRKPMARAAAA